MSHVRTRGKCKEISANKKKKTLSFFKPNVFFAYACRLPFVTCKQAYVVVGCTGRYEVEVL